MKLLTPLILVAILYLAIVVGVYLSQDRLLYHPDGSGPARAAAFGLEPWPDAHSYLGFVSRTPPDTPKGTFLVWHGNAGSALDRSYYVRALEPRGYRVVLLEYPGCGTRDGRRGEASFVEDARRATARAADEFGGPVYVLGESMGCGVATAVAAHSDPGVAGLVLITPWANLPDLAQSVYPFLPAKWLTRDEFDNVRNVRAYDGPVAVVMCGRDEVIPNVHSQRLYESIGSEKRLWWFENAGHNTWPTAPGEAWWDEMLRFVTGEPADGA